ncbi:hypothetical protein Pr1d_21230 [Bythopirellula goksoeyrii]|uniref:Uncharacterized protein n=1 Tax=Bythopirellula goksoeyrii TaxID=1400387 RepID=A0A5B9Q741_9BACT|nr:hypothetical protein Pr1d_21230 [Bythopirellula goksoeyrii]
MLTWLRLFLSCFCIVLCVLFTALWVRSWYYLDTVFESRLILSSIQLQRIEESIISANRVIGYGTNDRKGWSFVDKVADESRWHWTTTPLRQGNPQIKIMPAFLGFQYVNEMKPNGTRFRGIRLPIWFLVLSTGLIAAAIRPIPRWQFGLRELFVLSTIAAFILGPLGILMRYLGS